ncbi:HPr family phosphocarrier protein [Lachnospiraceae bacterium 38-14]|uniref:HPr family phosphocarrier protein n=1 Tax=Roseburia sp. 1XD42-69 TaxID=2320088 RepID=UPI000EA1CAED|nr:HPr family phosphocarrier protein [Roseburia sp. 1XD42-69]RKJ68714.1 HPr family phosphocarrier protein [Roseburia sp. 1XD42-69]
MNTELTLNLNDFEKVREFTNEANKFNSDIDILRDRYVIDAKSTLGIYTIDLSKPVTIRIISDDRAEIARFNEHMEQFL